MDKRIILSFIIGFAFNICASDFISFNHKPKEMREKKHEKPWLTQKCDAIKKFAKKHRGKIFAGIVATGILAFGYCASKPQNILKFDLTENLPSESPERLHPSAPPVGNEYNSRNFSGNYTTYLSYLDPGHPDYEEPLKMKNRQLEEV